MGILDGKVAIVTGAGTGAPQAIGCGVALALAKEGAAIAAVGRTFDRVAQTAETIRKFGGRALPIRCDVSVRADVDAAVAATVKEFGTVDILVNNAKSWHHARFEKITDEDMELVWRSGVMGTLYFMQGCFPYMKERGGKIINFASGSSTMGMLKRGAYASVNEGIRGMTKVAAVEWGQYGINVNVVCPAARPKWWLDSLTPEQLKAETELIPMRREGDPERDIGRAVVFLASQDSDFITSRTLHVDGGRSYYDR